MEGEDPKWTGTVIPWEWALVLEYLSVKTTQEIRFPVPSDWSKPNEDGC